MWEYSIKVSKENKIVSEKIFNFLKKRTNKYKSVIINSLQGEYYNISLAIDNRYTEYAQELLARIITKTICTNFKEFYLEHKLFLPSQDRINITAFKNALINFDKETDYFIISKNLILEGELYLESFFNFKLARLQEKWNELVKLANENREYLVCKEAFYDLLKFLIDNIDVTKREIKVVEENEGYRIIPSIEGEIEDFEDSVISSETLVSSLIELSPRKIELYYTKENDATNLLKTIYDKRLLPHNEFEEGNLKILHRSL